MLIEISRVSRARRVTGGSCFFEVTALLGAHRGLYGCRLGAREFSNMRSRAAQPSDRHQPHRRRTSGGADGAPTGRARL